MANFTSKKPSATYKSILNVGTSDNEELGSSLKVIEDGAGNDSAMRLALTNTFISTLRYAVLRKSQMIFWRWNIKVMV